METRRTPIAQLSRATKHFGKVKALDVVDLELRQGEVTALLGPNSAGKTTAVKLLMGLARPTTGSARLFGLDPRSADARVRVGAMLQVSNVPETLKVREHLELFRSYYPRPLPMDELLETAGLVGLEDRLYGKLSGGQRQRVNFALALAGDPELLFLDEPTVGLDVEARRGFWAVIRRLATAGRTLLLTTHYLEEADVLADRVVVISRGEIVSDGTPVELKARASVRRIRCTTAVPASELRRWPQIHQVSFDRGRVEITTVAAEVVLRQLFAMDPDLADREVVGAALEDAVLSLTSEPAPVLKGAA